MEPYFQGLLGIYLTYILLTNSINIPHIQWHLYSYDYRHSINWHSSNAYISESVLTHETSIGA